MSAGLGGLRAQPSVSNASRPIPRWEQLYRMHGERNRELRSQQEEFIARRVGAWPAFFRCVPFCAEPRPDATRCHQVPPRTTAFLSRRRSCGVAPPLGPSLTRVRLHASGGFCCPHVQTVRGTPPTTVPASSSNGVAALAPERRRPGSQRAHRPPICRSTEDTTVRNGSILPCTRLPDRSL